MTYKDIAHFLFQLLDDIDKIDDIAKGNDDQYRRLIRRINRRRFEVGATDGYNVWFHPETLCGDCHTPISEHDVLCD